jgi:ATP-binding cassette, subfamily A (ABC1), member 3
MRSALITASTVYVSLVQALVVIPMFIAYIGIAYTLPGAFGSERASLLTPHLKAMGLRDLPRIL